MCPNQLTTNYEEKMTDGELCLLCKADNKRSFLHSYQINLEEAIVLCENPQCSYPVGSTNCCATFSRSFSEVEPPLPKDGCSSVPEAQVALQTKMAEYSRNNAKLQRTVIGTQTDKRPLSRSSKTVASGLKFKSRNFVTNGNTSGPQANEKRNSNFEKLYNHTNQFKKENKCLYGKFISNGPSDNGKSQGAHNGTGNKSPVDVNGMKGFTGFTFNGREKVLKQTSKSEPPLDKLQNDMFLFSNPNIQKLQVASFHQGIQGKESNSKLINTSDNVIDKTAVMDTSSHIDSKTDRLSAKLKNQCLEQARTFFSYPKRFVQWRNKEALCWLDAVQCLIVHNRHIQKTVFNERFDRESVLFKLVNTHKQAQDLLVDLVNCENYDQHLLQSSSQDSEILSKSSSHEQLTSGISIVSPGKVEMKLVSIDGSVDVKTGAGNVGSSKTQNEIHTDGINVSELSDLQKATQIDKLLNMAREDVWHKLQPKLKFERRRNDSPVFTMSSLLREHPDVEKLFKMRYSFRFQCSHCGHCEEECFEKVLPTFPDVVKDFSITKPAHSRTCSHCGYKDARRTMEYQRLSDAIVMHFTEGLPYNNWKRLEFEQQGSIYTVTGMVQYINTPDHFIAWLRNPADGHWMKCDDLKSPVCEFQSDADIPSNQIHMVMWEKVPSQGDNCHTPSYADAILPATDISKFSSTINHDVANVSILNKNLQTTQYTALKALPNGQNEVLDKTGLLDRSVQNNISQYVPVSVDSANCSSVSEIPTGRCVIPKEARSSTLSSVCSDLSEDLLQFASAPPELFVVKPVPRLLPEDSKSELGTVSCDDHIFVCAKSAENVMVSTSNQVKTNITEVESNKLGHEISYNNCSKLSGQKSEIRPSSVFCPPHKRAPNVLCAKPEVRIKAQNVYPPFCVQKSGNTNIPINSKFASCERSVGSTLVCDTNVESNSQKVASLQKENTQHSSTNVRTALSKPLEHPAASVSVNSCGKGGKFRFPSVNRCDKSLITYLRSKKTSTSAIARDNFMMMNVSQHKPKIQPDLHSDQMVLSSSFNQLSSDGNASYLGKVQQYLLNKVNPCESKFDGLMLKSSKPEAAHMEVLAGQDRSVKTMDSTLSCRLISPMSECFGRKTDSPPKSAYSSVTNARKRNSSDKTFGHAKKTCIEKSLVNGRMNNTVLGRRQQTNNNGISKAHNGVPLININQKPLAIKDGSRNVAVEELLPLAENARKSPENSDCVLQDLYEALNIPFEDIGNTMANIMSDVDDILDFVKPTEMIPAASNNVFRGQTNIPQSYSKGLT